MTKIVNLDQHKRAKARAALAAKAEEIAQEFERADNLVVVYRDDDPMSGDDWRKAARLAGKLLDGRKVRTFSAHGEKDKPMATLVLHRDEQEREWKYYCHAIGTTPTGVRIPAPPFRKLR